MALASRAFADQRREQLFRSVPSQQPASVEVERPWQSIRNGEMPPMMFQLRLANGELLSYAYGDLREIRVRDAGFVQLGLYGMSRLLITIEGRHLRELAADLGSGLVRWLQEADDRDVERPESSPCVETISIDPYPSE